MSEASAFPLLEAIVKRWSIAIVFATVIGTASVVMYQVNEQKIKLEKIATTQIKMAEDIATIKGVLKGLDGVDLSLLSLED